MQLPRHDIKIPAGLRGQTAVLNWWLTGQGAPTPRIGIVWLIHKTTFTLKGERAPSRTQTEDHQ